jgi:hypothetical protein
MNECQIEYYDCIQPLEEFDNQAPAMDIPIQFVMDLPQFISIKIQPPPSMNRSLQTVTTPQKPLIPSLFQIAARADEVQAVPALKSALAHGHGPMAEMMLDPEKLEAVLKSVVRRKKPAVRRVSLGRFEH